MFDYINGRNINIIFIVLRNSIEIADKAERIKCIMYKSLNGIARTLKGLYT